MKDNEFIELINLYLDHELSAADAARLETEVRTNAGHRRIYEQYCRMQKACKMLATDFAAEAPATQPGKIRTFESVVAQRRPLGFFARGSLAAAAACVAFVLVSRVGPANNGDQVAVVPMPAVQSTEAAVSRSGGIVQRAALTGDSIALTRPVPAASGALAPQFAWMQGVQIAPINLAASADQLRFETKLLKVAPEPRPLMTVRKPVETAVERAAFEFRP
ncbi:MAG: zf-HC2 domain-containing protein [Opitutaceae bacterium]|nr:zf-HC2 domain-containing protein [Opitutaceae bacterium]